MMHNLDRIIDDVAREMTSVPHDNGLVRRVETRIASLGSERRRIWMSPALLAPLAAACILVVAVFVVRGRRPAVSAQPTPAQAVASVPAIVPDVATTDDARGSTARTGRAPRNPRAALSPVVTAIDIAPVQIERLDVMPIVQAQQIEIEIDPIAIARIEIAPMP